MKRFIAALTLLTIVFSFCMIPVYADPSWAEDGKGLPPGLQKQNKIPPGIAKKAFDDLTDNFWWAQKSIEKLKSKGYIKGYGDSSFRPAESFTQLETIIMALRIMGWEDEALNINMLPGKYRGKKVGEWAYGYVSVAYEKGILDDVDLMYFSPDEPAKRHEVAKYIIRAIGYEKEAQEHMSSELPFVDASAVPLGSVGYVYLVYEMELMVGDSNKAFNPMGTLTRAEMAVLFQRLDKKVDSQIEEKEVRGDVTRLYADYIEVRVKGKIQAFEVSESVIVYDRESKRIPYADIETGSFVLMLLEDEVVVYIEVIDKDEEEKKIISAYSGVVVGINYAAKQVTIRDGMLTLIFVVKDNAKVYLDDEKSDFDALRPGDFVRVLVDDKNRATEIRIQQREDDDEKEEIYGIITGIDLVGVYHITVSEDVYGGVEYRLSVNADVTIDGEEASLTDLVMGMEVKITLTDDIVTLINAANTSFVVDGEIASISDTYVVIELENEVRVVFWIMEDAVVRIDGKIRSVDHLNPGDTGEFVVKNNTVTVIRVTS